MHISIAFTLAGKNSRSKFIYPYKEVFTLRVFGELSFRQIASLFGKTENWAAVTFHRAKQKIMHAIQNN